MPNVRISSVLRLLGVNGLSLLPEVELSLAVSLRFNDGILTMVVGLGDPILTHSLVRPEEADGADTVDITSTSPVALVAGTIASLDGVSIVEVDTNPWESSDESLCIQRLSVVQWVFVTTRLRLE